MAILISFNAEFIELLGESVLKSRSGFKAVATNFLKSDFDLEDIRENLNDKFSSFGK